MKAPTFTLPDQDGNDVTLPAEGVVVLYFYPKADTPGCTKEANAFADRYAEYIDAGALILGVSPDPKDSLCSFKDDYELPFPLLSDEDHGVAESYGAWGTKQMYGKEYEGILRKTFLIVDGEIEQEWKHRPGKTEEEILAAIKER